MIKHIIFTVFLIFHALYLVIFDGTVGFLIISLALLFMQSFKQYKKITIILALILLCLAHAFWFIPIAVIAYFCVSKSLPLWILLVSLVVAQGYYQYSFIKSDNSGETWQKYGAL